MKKLFTLMAFVLIAGSAFGQKKWKDIAVNGDCEADAPAYTNYSECTDVNAWNSFWVHEWPTSDAQYQGTATIVDGQGVNGSRCVKVVARSEAEADAAGNKTDNNGALASWDAQFFIYGTEPMLAGKMVRLTMWVKADKDGSIESQAHYGPGDYNHYVLFGNINVTTEWTEVVKEATIDADQTKEGDGKFFQSIAFNLSTNVEGNTYYFDNIKFEIKDPKENDPNADWINFMRRGVYSADHIKGLNSSGEPWECTNFTIQTPEQRPAELELTDDGQMAVKVPVRGYYTADVEDLDEDGNQQFDDDGNVKMKTMYYWNDGEEIGTSAPARWTCQFFVSTLHKMETGERYRFKFKVKADVPSALGTQAHTGPGQYVSYNTFGDESAFPVGTDWTDYNLGEDQGQTVPSGANGCQTIVFDCVPLENQPNNFYFIFTECSFTEDRVTDADRTLGDTYEFPEEIELLVNTDDDEKATTIDISNMLNAFELNDLSFLASGKKGDGIKLRAMVEKEEEENLVEGFSSMLSWTDGGFVDGNGLFIDNENGIQIYFDDASADANFIDLMVWNNPDSGISFEDGKTVKTKLCISNDGWYYIYNVTLTAEGGSGIKDIQTNKKEGVIYDLMGRKVATPAKGLYIQNGKKYIQK